jgi:Dyp-type peroxidase family
MTQLDRTDIQGNVLEGYRFARTRSIFVRFRPKRGKVALAQLIAQLTTAQRWSCDEKPLSTLNIGISYAGLIALGIPDGHLTDCPQAFREGMPRRASALGDRPERFDDDWDEPVHLWLWLHACNDVDLAARQARVDSALAGSVQSRFQIDGYRMLDSDGQQIEHFGFRDGISQPGIVGSATPARPGDGVEREDGSWRSLATGEFLLGHRDESGQVGQFGAPIGLSANGTFAVFRRLEQNVPLFREYLQREAAKLHPIGDPELTKKWIAERMVGRRANGAALDREGVPGPDESLNAFTFRGDEEGRVCPLGSHVRRSNPRSALAFRDAFARHRILRRSHAYGPPFDEQREAAQEARERRGLLFVAINADIERQFEFLQRRYINDGAASRQGRDVDPLVGVPHGRNFVIPGDPTTKRDTLICSQLPELVFCRGGEYFFLPGKRALEAIRDAALDAPAVITGVSITDRVEAAQ